MNKCWVASWLDHHRILKHYNHVTILFNYKCPQVTSCPYFYHCLYHRGLRRSEFLLISCWVVAASLMTEKTNVGMAVFIADITSMCGCGSDGVAALLSACSLVRCCSHQFLFPCLEVLLQGTPPPCTISCKTLPGHSVDADSLHISYADIFVSPKRMSFGMRPSSILRTWHNHRSLRCLSRVYILGRPAWDKTSALVTLSCQDIPRILRRLLRWNELSLLSFPAYVVHVPLPYSNVLITQRHCRLPYLSSQTAWGLSTLEPWDELELKLPSQSSCRYLSPWRGCQWWWIRGRWTGRQHRVHIRLW